MGRQIHRLSALQVRNAVNPAKFCDGGGLYLQVQSATSKSWIFRFSVSHREHEMGLGSYPTVSLADAREKAAACRKDLGAGINPLSRKRTDQKAEIGSRVTFSEATKLVIADQSAGWRGDASAIQWTNSLKKHVEPIIGHMPIGELSTENILEVLKPIWGKNRETARRIRGRIETILNWAKVMGYRQGENPARWRGHLDQLLAKTSKIIRGHHAAAPLDLMPTIVMSLMARRGQAARALEFAILTATRTTEVREARWDEFDLQNETWRIPAERTKTGRELKIPLSQPAIRILRGQIQQALDYPFVFRGLGEKQPLSNMAMLTLLQRKMGYSNFTVHGFRSSFRDWAAEKTNYQGELAELALGHAIPNQVEASYRRGDQFDKRKDMMDDWAKFCGYPKNIFKSVA